VICQECPITSCTIIASTPFVTKSECKEEAEELQCGFGFTAEITLKRSIID
jgi:hypothetical protein